MAKKPATNGTTSEVEDDLDDTDTGNPVDDNDDGDSSEDDGDIDDSEVDADGEDDLTSDSDIDNHLSDLIDREFLNDAKAKTKKGDDGKPAKDGQRSPTRKDDSSGRPKNDGAQLLQRYANTYLTQDKNGNLVDPATGTVVANAGRERFYFEQARAGRKQNEKLMRAAQQSIDAGKEMYAKVQAYESMNKSGLNITEQTQAIQLYNSWKQNPVATLKYILTEAAANGTDLSAVLGKNGSGIDMGAIKQLIQNELKPVIEPTRQRQRQSEQETEVMRRAQAQAEYFFDQFPDAVIHEKVLADFITRFPQSSPEAVYVRLKEWAARQGLDWAKPLAPQIAARRNNGRDGQTTRRRSLPPNRTQREISNSPDEGGSLDANASSADIVRQAMREANFNV